MDAAIDHLILKHQLFVPGDIPKLKELALTKPQWDRIDPVDKTVANIAGRFPEVNEILLEWNISDSIWFRRIAIIHQRLRKEKTDMGLLEKVIINNLNQDEFFINELSAGHSDSTARRILTEWGGYSKR